MAKQSLIKKAIDENLTYFKNFNLTFEDNILKGHNINVYKKIIKGFQRGNKVLFEQATGTGKSFIVLKFLYDHAKGKRVLYVSPSKAIQDSFSENYQKFLGKNFDCTFETCLYQGLSGTTKKQYDIIIFDEVHRMGAKIWGANAEVLINNNPKANILGMTATMERTDGADITKYFDNKKPVSTLTLVEALEKGILPRPDYMLAKIDFSDDNEFIDNCIKDFKKRLKNADESDREKIIDYLEKLKRAKQFISESKDISTIFANELQTKELKRGKFIVFCPAGENEEETQESIHKMKSIMKQSSNWFSQVEGIKKVKKYCVYSKMSAQKNKKIIKTFESDSSKSLKLLFSINMLNEGLHIDDIDGVIMLRSTSSRIVYLQQLGRALSVGHKLKPKIFDFVANLNYIDVKSIQDIAERVNKGSTLEVQSTEKQTENSKLMFNLVVDNLEVLQLIHQLRNNIFGYRHKNDFVFEDFYSRLVAFKKRNGHIRIRTVEEDIDKYPLGQKLLAIRQKTIRTTEEQRQKLIDLGLTVTLRNMRFDFEGFCLKLMEYKEKYGHLNIRKNEIDETGYPFGQKLSNIKSGNIKLTAEQRQKLIDLGLNLEKQIREFKFEYEDFYKRIVDFKEQFGHLKIVQTTIQEDGYPLGPKYRDIKGGKIKLTEEQKQELINLGLDFSTNGNFFDFEEFYLKLVKYKEKYGHLNIPRREVIDGYGVGNAISKIKSGVKKITEEQRSRLEELGIEFKNTRKFDFEGFYARLLAYKQRNGHINIKYKETDLDDYPLGIKIANIKQKILKITEEQVQMLINLGVDLSIKKSEFPFIFDEFYLKCVRFKETFGNLKVKQEYKDIDGYPLGKKLKYVKMGDMRLTEEQKQLLFDLGLEINRFENNSLKF